MMPKTPKISIVTPSLNQGRFITQCLESVAIQNWPNVEHIVVDGGSTDGTLEILKSHASQLTRVISEKDDGAADAINKGFRLCTGDIVAWLNADDFYLPGAFEVVTEAWKMHPDAAFWFGNGNRVFENGSLKSIFNPGTMLYNHKALVEGLDYILQPATFIHGQWLRQVGYLRTHLRWGFDWDLWIRLANLSRPVALGHCLAASREWESTLTASGGFKRAEELRCLAEEHCGKSITYGALRYWLDTLRGFVATNDGEYGRSVFGAVNALDARVQCEMRRLGVDDGGMPIMEHFSVTAEQYPVSEVMTDAVVERPDLVCHRVETDSRRVIGVDLFPLYPGASGGIVPWIQGVLRAMIRLYPNDQMILFHRLGEPPLKLTGANVQYIGLAEQTEAFFAEMSLRFKELNGDVLIRSYPHTHHPDIPFERQIFVIPDIQHEYYPEFFERDVLTARRQAFSVALSRAGGIATMTEHSRKTLLDNPWTKCEDIFLMPAALPDELVAHAGTDSLPEQARHFDHYFYMPANLWQHKNHQRLFQAFEMALPDLPPRTGLILTGNPDGFSQLIKGFENLPIVHLGYVSHNQVSALFQHASALVYFSLFEGFGMPLLEAFHHGTAVLCSNIPPLLEVGGDAVLSCDPKDHLAMAQLMIRLMREPELKPYLAQHYAQRLAVYDWNGPARSLRQAIERVIRNAVAETVYRPSKISIVMPTRNHGKFIRAAIDSVLDQQDPAFELWVMDGASTDDTVEILKSYGTRIQWVSEPDKGQTDAINKGMYRVNGDILAYLNSDDILLPGSLRTVRNFFEENPECDMVYGNADYIDVEGGIIGTYATASYSFERLMRDCCVCQPSTFWRRRIADRVGEFNVKLQTAMDYEYWLRMANAGAVIRNIQDKLAQSRLHKDAKTLAMRGTVYREIFQICREQGGYVSYSYYHGFWFYRIFESWWGGPYVKRHFPRAYLPPAFLHYLLQVTALEGKQQARIMLSRRIMKTIDARFPRIGSLVRKAKSVSSRHRISSHR